MNTQTMEVTLESEMPSVAVNSIFGDQPFYHEEVAVNVAALSYEEFIEFLNDIDDHFENLE